MKNPKTHRLSLALAVASAFLLAPSTALKAQERPTFRSSVALVPITALVRDSRNRIVRNLLRDDFQVLEQGAPRPIVDFGARDDAPVSVAFLFDTSGSMRVASNLEKGKALVELFSAQMNPAVDEIALFTFDRALRQEVAFTNDRDRIHRALGHVRPWGLTSLYDAIAETAKQLGDRPAPRRAVVVITDGVDTSSALTSAEVSGLASAIDVPVYVMAVVSPLDHPDRAESVGHSLRGAEAVGAQSNLSDLAYWTGGDLLYVTASEQAAVMTGQLLAGMRQQYFLAIESSTAPGWYGLEVRTKRQGLTVRARSGYFSAPLARTGDGDPAIDASSRSNR
jgi:Ca-activated chloride channel family protein